MGDATPHLSGDGGSVTASSDGTTVPDDAALSTDERIELERLRAEVAELRSQAAAAPSAVTEQPVVPPPSVRPRRQRWRSGSGRRIGASRH